MQFSKLMLVSIFLMFYLTTLTAQTTIGSMVVGQGVTKPSDWVNYNPGQGAKGIYVDVNTSACGFTSTPHYLVTLESITNSGYHWQVSGVPSVYAPTPTGFRVYIRWTDHPTDRATIGNTAEPNPLRASTANAKGWVIRWTGIVAADCANTGTGTSQNMSIEKTSLVEDKTSDVVLFPNPSNTSINIQTTEPISKCVIYDLQGNLLMTSNEATINISALPSGSYNANIFWGEKMVIKQFIKKD